MPLGEPSSLEPARGPVIFSELVSLWLAGSLTFDTPARCMRHIEQTIAAGLE